MAQIPKAVLDRQPTLLGLKVIGRGKVRDTYELPNHPDKMLVVASDRISIFDFVLSALIVSKGAILTAMNHFWTKMLAPICATDMVACGAEIDQYLPANLQGNVDLQTRATVVQRLTPPDVEDIVRLHLTGSGWKSYQKNGTVCGHCLPLDLLDGSELPYALYTPTTKAEVGHDVHIGADDVAESHGHVRERLALQCAQAMAAYAKTRGIILADTKFEFSQTGRNQDIVLADEKGTPDSSRFWDLVAWKKSMAKGKLPPAFDKQFVREWGKGLGIDNLDPEKPGDVGRVHGLKVPADVVAMTTRIYRYIFWRLTGKKIEDYQREEMGIAVPFAEPHIEVLVGSESDLPQLERGLEWLKGKAKVCVSVISCHRNPDELRAYVESDLYLADVVIAGAGMAAALPGVVKALLVASGCPQIPVIGVAMSGATPENDRDATGSIKGLPGQPVELDQNGEAHLGSEGFWNACQAALRHEFLPKTIEAKPAKLDVWHS